MFIDRLKIIEKEPQSHLNESSLNSLDIKIINKNAKKKFESESNSLNKTGSSFGDNYSTENSSVEIEKKKTRILTETDLEYIKNNNELKDNQIDDVYKDLGLLCEENNLEENEYLDDIFNNLINEEINNKYKINSNYFNFQNDINDKMRKVLIDWLIEIHYKLKFKEETFYTTIYIIDAYLSQKRIERKNLQLLGITAIFIASKLYEINSGNIEDYSNITAKTYNKEEIINMESDISKTLNLIF